MKQCWDANPSKRPDKDTLWNKINEMIISYYQNENEEWQINNNININNVWLNTNYISSGSINLLARKFSQIHIFEGLPEPRNATKGKLLKFHLLYLITKFNHYIIIYFIF